MMYLHESRFSPEEVIQEMRSHGVYPNLNVVDVNGYEFKNGLGPYYDYWSNIKHPVTGETLHAVRGYVGESHNNDGCYYAEYVDEKGNYYSYVHQFPVRDEEGKLLVEEKNIGQQQYEDKQIREKSNFADIVNKYKLEHKDRTQERATFYSNTKIGNYLRSVQQKNEEQNISKNNDYSVKK